MLDWGYDAALARRLGDGARWGVRLLYMGADNGTTLKDQIARHAGFLDGGKVRFVLDNAVGGRPVRPGR